MSRARALGFRAALSDLYKIYWYSLFAYVGRGGHAPEEAQGSHPWVLGLTRAQDAGTRGPAEGQVPVVFA
jgi:hypothetical protein